MKVYGQLENATAELLASDPASTVLGRIWFNTTTGRLMLGDGSVKQPLLRNDQKIVIGTNGTAASNVRFNRAAAGLLQLVTGDDATAEGSLSTAVAQLDSRVANFTTLARPAAASAGRIIYDTTLSSVLFDNGANYKLLTTNPMTAAGDILYSSDANGTPARLAKGSDAQLLTLASGVPSWANAPATPINYLSKTGNYTAVANDWVFCSGASFTVTLPTAVSIAGKQIVIQHAGTSLTQVYTINTTSAQTVGGIASGSYALYTNGECLTVVSDGANWQIIHHYSSTSWVSAGSLVITAITTAPTQAGNTKTVDRMLWRRVGTNMEVQLEFVQTLAGSNTPGSGDYLFQIPAAADSNLITYDVEASLGLNVQGAAKNNMGTIYAEGSGNTTGILYVVMYDSTHFRLMGVYSNTSSVNNNYSIGSAAGALNTSSNILTGRFSVPISGWQP